MSVPLLNTHKLGNAMFAKVGQELQAPGFQVHTGTIVDTTIIGAPSSTKMRTRHVTPRCILMESMQ